MRMGHVLPKPSMTIIHPVLLYSMCSLHDVDRALSIAEIAATLYIVAVAAPTLRLAKLQRRHSSGRTVSIFISSPERRSWVCTTPLGNNRMARQVRSPRGRTGTTSQILRLI